VKKRNGPSRPGERLTKIIDEQVEHRDRVRRANEERCETSFSDLQPDPAMEREFFGGFKSTDQELSAKAREDGRHGDFTCFRQRSPGWAAEMPQGYPPFVLKRLWEREHQERPAVTPERDRADEIKRQAARQEKLDAPTSASAGPSKLFARGIRLEERSSFASRGPVAEPNDGVDRYEYFNDRLEDHCANEWRDCRELKPSRRLEAKRFPRLKRVEPNPLLTETYLRRGLKSEKDKRRAFATEKVTEFLTKGGIVKVCPPETLAAKLRKPKMGRPRVYDRPMTAAERQAASRATKVITLAPNQRVRPGALQRLHPPLKASGFLFYPTRGGLMRVIGLPSRVVALEPGVFQVIPVRTPRKATSSLVGAATIPQPSEIALLSAKLHALEEQRRALANSNDELAKRRARAREAKAAVAVWRAQMREAA